MEILCRPLPMTILASTGITSPNNLLNERLGRAAQFVGAGYVAIDLGAVKSIDTIALLATNSPGPGIAFSAAYYPTQADAVAGTNGVTIDSWSSWASAEAGYRVHRQSIYSFSPISARYLRVASSSDIAIGRLVVGKRFAPAEQRDYEWDFTVVDLGENRRAASGLDDPTIRGKVMQYSWSWSGLTKDEARGAMLDLLAYAGTTRDLLVCLDDEAADRHNLIGYGKLPEPIIVPNTAEDWYTAKFTLLSRLILSL